MSERKVQYWKEKSLRDVTTTEKEKKTFYFIHDSWAIQVYMKKMGVSIIMLIKMKIN
jgi:hypothetical protein